MSEAGKINRFRKYQWRLSHNKKLPKQVSKEDYKKMEQIFATSAIKQKAKEVIGDPIKKAEEEAAKKAGAKK